MKVDLLMATYNGAKHIESQILSLIAQSHKEWRLIIHDDGSIDDTLFIIQKFADLDSRVSLITDGLKFGNAGYNFMHLLKFSNAEYVMFCDQDDIWFDNKIKSHLDVIIERNNKIPQVVYSNAYVWIPEEGIKGNATLTFPKHINQFLFLNSGMQGCVVMFNQVMCETLRSYVGTVAMHDHTLHFAALSLGEVYYLPQCLMLYRNHDDNVTGETFTSSNNFKQIAANRNIPVVDRKHYNAVYDLFKQFKGQISASNVVKIEKYLLMPDLSAFQRFCAILTENFQLFDSRFRLIVKLILRPYINN